MPRTTLVMEGITDAQRGVLLGLLDKCIEELEKLVGLPDGPRSYNRKARAVWNILYYGFCTIMPKEEILDAWEACILEAYKNEPFFGALMKIVNKERR